MNNIEDSSTKKPIEQHKRRIVNVSSHKTSVQQPQEQEDKQKQYPLEMQPVLDAVIEYARRTYSLGLLHGAEELDSIVEYISNMDSKNPQVSQIMNFIQDRSKIFKNAFNRGYGQ